MNRKKNKIVFLDAGSIDYGDLSLAPLSKLGLFKAYPNTPSNQIVARSRGANILIVNKSPLTKAVLRGLVDVKCICVAATGVNNVDLIAARDQEIIVMNAVGYSTETVAQFTLSYILALSENLIRYNEASHRGDWSKSEHFTLGDYPNREVAGKTLGILGYGAIGKRVAVLAEAFGMKVIVGKIPSKSYSKLDAKHRLPLHRLVRKADFLSIHTPLSDLTRNLINAKIIRMMKPGSFLINAARGGVVDELALFKALKLGHLGGAACDVLTTEPPPKKHRLFGAPNLILTPHIAWASLEARKRLLGEIILNIQAFQQGRKRNRVNPL